MTIVARIAILGLHPRQTRTTGAHSYTNLSNPLSRSY